MIEVLLGLGANEGDPLRQLRLAVAEIRDLIAMSAVSSVYRTEPEGWHDQPDFLNLVCVGRTERSPDALHRELLRIERELGREHRPRNAPRRIDVDLLAVGALVLSTPDLVIPHPRLHERAFVLVPLAEIAPHWRHPVLGATGAELLAALDAPGRVERLGPLEVMDTGAS